MHPLMPHSVQQLGLASASARQGFVKTRQQNHHQQNWWPAHLDAGLRVVKPTFTTSSGFTTVAATMEAPAAAMNLSENRKGASSCLTAAGSTG
jgi:hypothetical protein